MARGDAVDRLVLAEDPLAQLAGQIAQRWRPLLETAATGRPLMLATTAATSLPVITWRRPEPEWGIVWRVRSVPGHRRRRPRYRLATRAASSGHPPRR